MRKISIENNKTASGKAIKFIAADSSGGELQKRVKHAVVPSEFQSKVLIYCESVYNLFVKTETDNAPAASDPLVWFELYGDYLFAYARRRVREESAAEDLVQETFLAAISSNNSFAGNSSEKTWLTGILKHKIYDYYAKTSRRSELTAEEADLSSYNFQFERAEEWDGHWNEKYAPADWDKTSPLKQVEDEEFQQIFSSCLTGLPERIAGVFVMREVDGLTSAEICGVLTISNNNYWTMMHRARLHLRRCLEINWFLAPKTFAN